MSKRQISTIIFLIVSFSTTAFAQTNRFTISGTIKDKKSGETIIGSIIRVSEIKGIGASTNEYGFYSLTIAEGKYSLEITSLGYKKIVKEIVLDKNLSLNFSLESEVSELNEVAVASEKEDKNVRSAEAGVVKLDVKEISKIPVFAGEKDIIKTLQLT
ncbi:MAG: carboxypeptidase-like regulatory domain-containing protein, partial [Bacteroidia bacterium]